MDILSAIKYTPRWPGLQRRKMLSLLFCLSLRHEKCIIVYINLTKFGQRQMAKNFRFWKTEKLTSNMFENAPALSLFLLQHALLFLIINYLSTHT